MQLSSIIESLLQLQQVDQRIEHLTILIETLPIQAQEALTKAKEMATAHDELTKKIVFLHKKKSETSTTMASLENSLSENRNLLVLASDEKERIITLKQLDSLEKQLRKVEEESLLLYEEISLREQELADLTVALSEQTALAEQYKHDTPTLLDNYTKEKEMLQNKRSKLQKTIPAPMIERYEFIHSRIQGDVLAQVEQGICKTCQVSLPTQLLMNLPNAQQIYTCPSCRRILYLA